MICERCGHKHVESVKRWKTVTLPFEECIVDLRADLTETRHLMHAANDEHARLELEHDNECRRVVAQLAESRQHELDAETRACAAEERAARAAAALRRFGHHSAGCATHADETWMHSDAESCGSCT